jgi:hypothetical protein
MDKIKYLFLMILLCGCFTRSAYLSQETYNSIQVGESISTVVDKAGDPYTVRTLKSGEQEYEYIELFSTGTSLVYYNHYFFVVKDGKIVGKRMVYRQEPPYDLIYQDDPNHPYYP